MDAARVLARLGAEPTIYYRRRLADLPALAEEVEEAREEGVRIEPLLSPERIERRKGGALRLHLRPMAVSTQGEDGRYRVQASGEPLNAVDVTAVFVAVGGLPSAGLPSEAQPPHVRTVGTHLALIAPEGPFARRPVFVGGDLVNARRTVVTAIASGKEAALAIHAALQGQAPERALAAARATRDGPVSMALAACAESTGGRVIGPEDLNLAYFRHDSRRSGPRISASRRQTGFDEVRRDLSATAALGEARRCFHCGLCDQCDNCYRFCPDLSVLRDVLAGSREIDYDHCKGCGICAEECPRGVIELRPE
jgi:2-oxoacid:acceptor oxidoreductase delta subunit (pyruvate/2-ketoisovalerate family)